MAPWIQSLTVVAGNLVVKVSDGAANAPCTLWSTPDPSLPGSAWTSVATGVFDAQGKCVFTRAINTTESARFFRVQQP